MSPISYVPSSSPVQHVLREREGSTAAVSTSMAVLARALVAMLRTCIGYNICPFNVSINHLMANETIHYNMCTWALCPVRTCFAIIPSMAILSAEMLL
jgi:hypothetical protein